MGDLLTHRFIAQGTVPTVFVGPKGWCRPHTISSQSEFHVHVLSSQLLPPCSQLRRVSIYAEDRPVNSLHRSFTTPRPRFNNFTMVKSTAESNVSGVETLVARSGIAEEGSTLQSESIPVFSLTEVAKRLQEYTSPKCKPYAAMYSSVVGGITLDPAAMVVPLDDHIVHRGHGVFDTATVFEGCLYELDAHLDRLLRSASLARITPPFSRSVLRNILVQTVATSGAREGALRYWLSAGPGGFQLSPSECERGSFYAVMLPDKAVVGSEGVKVITTTVPIKAPQFATMKSTNYLPNALAKMEAEDKGAFQAIWLDEEGFIAEGANMNVAFVSKGELFTPSFDKILSGCTIKRLLTLAHKLKTGPGANGAILRNIRVGKVTVEEARAADEMMLVVSSSLIIPVVQWDDKPVGSGKVGPVFKSLLATMQRDLTDGPPEVREQVPYTG